MGANRLGAGDVGNIDSMQGLETLHILVDQGYERHRRSEKLGGKLSDRVEARFRRRPTYPEV